MSDPNPTTETPQQQIALSPAREKMQIERQTAMALTTFSRDVSVFNNGDAFKLAIQMAERVCNSDMIPETYRGKPDNVIIAIDYANRLGVGVLELMQQMDVVKGRPGLRGAFQKALVDNSGVFATRIKYEWRGEDNPGGEPSTDFGCRAWALDKDGDRIEGTWIDWRMVKGEGWDKNGKWTTMREQMFQYRAAAFFSRANAADVTLGMYSKEELDDLSVIDGTFTNVAAGKVGGGSAKDRLQERLDRSEREAGGDGGADGPGYTPVDMSTKEPGDGLSTVQMADAGDKVPDPSKPTGRKPRVRKAVEPAVQDSDDNADGTPNTDPIKPTPEPEVKPAADNTAFDLE